MTDAAVVGRILREYRLGSVFVRRRCGSVAGTRVGYEFQQLGRGAVLVRAYREDAPLAEYLQGAGSVSVIGWLQGRAAIFGWLAERGYPAPRLVPTREGDPIGVAGPWLTMATEFVPGPALARGQLGLLGAALGRLHALPVLPAEPSLGLASWHPAVAIPAALGRLDAVAALLPGEWRPLHERFRAALLAVQRATPGLPRAVVHGDAWPGNAVVTPDGQAALINWENGGLGLPVVDLGNCLLECHLDPGLPAGQPVAWHIQPDPGRIAAGRLRPLDEKSFPIRFATAYVGAIHFERALIDGVRGPTMDARLDRLHNRIAVSQAVADLAARHLG